MIETPRQAAQRHHTSATEQMQGRSDGRGFWVAFERCESPIEQMFCLALFQVPGIYAFREFRPSWFDNHPKTRGIIVFAQQPIKRYRVDFLLVALSPEENITPQYLVVECDGQEFHGDVMCDIARQQDINLPIIRHLGTEIYDDPRNVVGITLQHFQGWTNYDANPVDSRLIREAMKTLWHADGDPNMGYRPPTLKPLAAPIGAALQQAEEAFRKSHADDPVHQTHAELGIGVSKHEEAAE